MIDFIIIVAFTGLLITIANVTVPAYYKHKRKKLYALFDSIANPKQMSKENVVLFYEKMNTMMDNLKYKFLCSINNEKQEFVIPERKISNIEERLNETIRVVGDIVYIKKENSFMNIGTKEKFNNILELNNGKLYCYVNGQKIEI